MTGAANRQAELVAFRVDASLQMGSGHVMRCLTLADAVRGAGFDTVFLISPQAASWHALIEARGHSVRVLDVPAGGAGGGLWLPWGWQADAEATRTALPHKAAWLVVDHYGLDAQFERALRARADQILAIDDLADRPHDCDILLDQNQQPEDGTRYLGLVAPSCRLLIGPRFALLRPEFEGLAARRQPGNRNRVHVFMGGADSRASTLKVLAELASLDAISIDVVAGSVFPCLAELERAAAARPSIRLHVDVADMTPLLLAADVAVGAGGVASIERCAAGLPTVAVAIAANQEPGLGELGKAGAVAYLGRFGDLKPGAIGTAVVSLLAKPERLIEMSRRCAGLCDGRGAGRTLTALRLAHVS